VNSITSHRMAATPPSATSRRDTLRSNALAIVLVALLAAAGLGAPSLFSADNLANMALQFAPLGVVVVGQMLVILVRGLDLSVSSVMATSAVIATSFAGQNADLIWIVALALGMGALVGAVNGLLVTKRQVSPFLATLATMIVL
jgi:ribose/xylose/arabinose/galactoside ABC-type transport system permease subunit